MAEPFMGEIRLMSFGFAPKGWALCNGQVLAIAQNQALFALLGTRYGGNGQTNFALPDLQGRVPIHTGNGHTQGERGGQESHVLSTAEMPTHRHALSGTSSTGDIPVPAGGLLADSPAQLYSSNAAALTSLSPGSVMNSGGSQPHENRQPFLALSFCIATQGIFPSRN